MTRTPPDGFDDYSHEMERISHEDVEAVVAELRHDLLRDPDPEVADRHLAAMLAAAGAEAEVLDIGLARRKRGLMRIFTKKRAATLGLAATLTLGMGLAGASELGLPDQAAGLVPNTISEMLADLPAGPPDGAEDGDEPADAAEHGQTVSGAAQSLEGGCEKGQAVSAIASSRSTEHRQDDADRPDPCTAGRDEGDGEDGDGDDQAGGPPEGVRTGPPEGTPDGPPEGTPNGPPEGTPNGPPEGTPNGPPDDVPAGPPGGDRP